MPSAIVGAGLTAIGVGRAGPERASERRAGVLWTPISRGTRSIRPAARSRVKPRWSAEQQRAAAQRHDDGIGRPAAELLEHLVGERRGAGQERRLPEVRGVGDLGSGVLERPLALPRRPPTGARAP